MVWLPKEQLRHTQALRALDLEGHCKAASLANFLRTWRFCAVVWSIMAGVQAHSDFHRGENTSSNAWQQEELSGRVDAAVRVGVRVERLVLPAATAIRASCVSKVNSGEPRAQQ